MILFLNSDSRVKGRRFYSFVVLLKTQNFSEVSICAAIDTLPILGGLIDRESTNRRLLTRHVSSKLNGNCPSTCPIAGCPTPQLSTHNHLTLWCHPLPTQASREMGDCKPVIVSRLHTAVVNVWPPRNDTGWNRCLKKIIHGVNNLRWQTSSVRCWEMFSSMLRSFHMMTSSNGNNFRVTSFLCGQFTGHRWISRTKTSDAELYYFLSSVPEPTVE